MTDYHHLSTQNAPRTCGACGAPATAYDHDLGFRCGDCGNYPASRRNTQPDATDDRPQRARGTNGGDS